MCVLTFINTNFKRLTVCESTRSILTYERITTLSAIRATDPRIPKAYHTMIQFSKFIQNKVPPFPFLLLTWLTRNWGLADILNSFCSNLNSKLAVCPNKCQRDFAYSFISSSFNWVVWTCIVLTFRIRVYTPSTYLLKNTANISAKN